MKLRVTRTVISVEPVHTRCRRLLDIVYERKGFFGKVERFQAVGYSAVWHCRRSGRRFPTHVESWLSNQAFNFELEESLRGY